MRAYYNEYDPKAVEWLRELIKQKHIADGDVDERSILDVTPNDLKGYNQCHFFAGIGVWSYALRLAGWPDDRPVWTGSCPCQPFSSAGKGAGFADERHLWPAFHWLISQCKPVFVFGEQVAGKAGEAWLDLVSHDLENTGYTFGAAVTAACGFGAPHQRKRLYWLAHTDEQLARRIGRNASSETSGLGNATRTNWGRRAEVADPGQSGGNEGTDRAAGYACGMDNADSSRQQADRPSTIWNGSQSQIVIRGAASGLAHTDVQGLEGFGRGHQAQGGRVGEAGSVAEAGELGGLGDSTQSTCERNAGSVLRTETQEHGERIAVNGGVPVGLEHASTGLAQGTPYAGPTNGFWRDADWLFCRDGKWRPVEPSTFPLAHGAAARVGRLRGYGNAIVAQQAKAFIEAFTEAGE